MRARWAAIHRESHRSDRIGWLRAAVMGANDGVVSTASLVVGVAATGATQSAVLVAGVAGLVAGAMSMAAGEYVSVSSQSDTETSDSARERRELAADPDGELQELSAIYEARGLDTALALQVATRLTAKGALEAHMRDELGITEHQRARPLQAAMASAASFAVGAALPLLAGWVAAPTRISVLVTGASLAVLLALGWISASAGGANPRTGAIRVAFWGAIAMALTWGVGRLFGSVV